MYGNELGSKTITWVWCYNIRYGQYIRKLEEKVTCLARQRHLNLI